MVVTRIFHKSTNSAAEFCTSKVPAVTLGFWIIKIAATTIGETGGDALSMTLNLGYALSTAIFFVFFAVAVTAQIKADKFNPFLYWTVIVATTTVGTTMADFADRSLGIGYVGGSAILFALVMAALGLWRLALGSVSVNTIISPRQEAFYWVTILLSNTLGTALGDFLADDSGLGYEGGALVFAAALALLAVAYFTTRISRTLLFWLAFILTRPLGATCGDLLTKPISDGGLHLGRFTSSAVIAVFITLCVLILPQRAGSHPGERVEIP
ncbi:MAG TPA: hypothetical protein VJ770_16155 [Stellaceae bacterium]|nr:hypothetical protein [Stellaceae bacterium]